MRTQISSRPPLALAAGLALLAVMLWPSGAYAASGAADGSKLGLFWVLPFAGLLGSLALLPMVAARFWHRNYGLVALFWALAFLAPFAAAFGAGVAFRQLVHVLVLEYIPFIALIGALFVIAGGIYIGGEIRATPALNAAVMAAGIVLANFAGTTGAAMILIRPIIRANRHRERKAHVIVFFIFLVCNIGGALTPLGDPPLLLGYLEGVDFSWPLKALWPHMLFAGGIVLAMFFALDSYLYAKESKPVPRPSARRAPYVRGLVNLPLLALVVALVAASGSNGWGTVDIFGTAVPWKGLFRDLALDRLRRLIARANPAHLPGAERVPLGAAHRGGEIVRRHFHHRASRLSPS